MGFELWKTLGISGPSGLLALAAGALGATVAAVLVSRRRATKPVRAGLKLGAHD